MLSEIKIGKIVEEGQISVVAPPHPGFVEWCKTAGKSRGRRTAKYYFPAEKEAELMAQIERWFGSFSDICPGDRLLVVPGQWHLSHNNDQQLVGRDLRLVHPLQVGGRSFSTEWAPDGTPTICGCMGTVGEAYRPGCSEWGYWQPWFMATLGDLPEWRDPHTPGSVMEGTGGNGWLNSKILLENSMSPIAAVEPIKRPLCPACGRYALPEGCSVEGYLIWGYFNAHPQSVRFGSAEWYDNHELAFRIGEGTRLEIGRRTTTPWPNIGATAPVEFYHERQESFSVILRGAGYQSPEVLVVWKTPEGRRIDRAHWLNYRFSAFDPAVVTVGKSCSDCGLLQSVEFERHQKA